MGKLPVLSGLDLIKILKKIGFEPVRQKGSHVVLVNNSGGPKRAIVVPNHTEIDQGTLLEIIRQAGLKRDDFEKLL
ncbi:MAG: type II toxin-antitoxin system HicA family toxin [Candidatus Methanoperedens sp.]|nr:type II toxin-antitoxin system HicA family toxin [Candidatus Methanoperedens sp.]